MEENCQILAFISSRGHIIASKDTQGVLFFFCFSKLNMSKFFFKYTNFSIFTIAINIGMLKYV